MGSQLDNAVPVNVYDFSEPTSNDKQPLVANAEGRTVLFAELVYLGSYFGDVTDQDGIANAASGRINIDSDRTIRTEQIKAADTFTVGNELWFVSGGAGAAGTLEDSDPGSGTRVAVGVITEEEGTGGAQTSVTFRPYVQLQAAVAAVAAINAEPKTIIAKITADASAGIAVAGLAIGDEIVGVHVICTVTNGSGTLVLEDGDGDDITDGIACDTADAVAYMATLDDSKSTLPASGAQIISVGGTAANTRGIMIITYIPA